MGLSGVFKSNPDDWWPQLPQKPHDVSFLVKASVASLCKSKDLVNKCSEALKINRSYHPNSFISSASDICNSLSTKRGIIPLWKDTLHFYRDDVHLQGQVFHFQSLKIYVSKLWRLFIPAWCTRIFSSHLSSSQPGSQRRREEEM